MTSHDMRPSLWMDSRSFDGSGLTGDFCECLDLPGDRRAIIVGDVAGHGARAHGSASTLRSFLRSLIVPGMPAELVLAESDVFFERAHTNDPTAFASLFVAVADLGNRFLTYASAGHDTALLFSGIGTHVHLEPTGPILGLGCNARFGSRSHRLGSESTLVVVTDGITEARPAIDPTAFFGTAGVARAFSRASLENPARAIQQSAAQHARAKLADDASVVVASLARVVRLRPPDVAFTGDRHRFTLAGAHVPLFS